MTYDEKFRQKRRIISLWNFALDLIGDIQSEHDAMIERHGESLGDMEEFLEQQGYKVELCHLANYARFLDEAKIKSFRKKILDHGNNLIRELESEN